MTVGVLFVCVCVCRQGGELAHMFGGQRTTSDAVSQQQVHLVTDTKSLTGPQLISQATLTDQ